MTQIFYLSNGQCVQQTWMKSKLQGAIFVRLHGKDACGKKHTARVMVYVNPSTEKFYLSREEALIQLGVIPKVFQRFELLWNHPLLRPKQLNVDVQRDHFPQDVQLNSHSLHAQRM